MPLMLVQPGSRVRVARIEGGTRLGRHLAAMGIYTGTQLRLIKGGLGGPVIIEVAGSRLVLGRGMAQRLMVTPANESPSVVELN